jgi:hypothetical protein
MDRRDYMWPLVSELPTLPFMRLSA